MSPYLKNLKQIQKEVQQATRTTPFHLRDALLLSGSTVKLDR